MTSTKKLKSSEFIITTSFYAVLFLIPAFAQEGYADFSLYSSFFFNRNLNILICLVPAALAVFFAKTDFRNKYLTLALTDTLILFFIHTEFFVSANYHLNLLTAIFILLFILINTNELFAVAGIIPFFFLSRLDIFHYVLIVAIPLIALLIIKLNQAEGRIKKTAMRITLFIQCYICLFFVALLVAEIYYLNISITLPQYVTTQFITGAVASLILPVLLFICFTVNIFRNKQIKKVATKLLFTLSAFIIIFIGIAGYFTDIISPLNKTAILISLIYIVIFNTQYSLSYSTEQKCNSRIADIITVSALILFSLSMMS